MNCAPSVVVVALLSGLTAQDPVPTIPAAPVDRLLVCNKAANSLSIFDVATHRELAVVPTGAGPHEVAISPDGRTAVVSDYGDRKPGSTLTVVDVEAGAVVRTIVLTRKDVGDGEKLFLRPHGVRFVAPTQVLVTSESAQRLLRVAVDTGEVQRTWPTPQHTMHMVAITHDGKHAAATSVSDGSVMRFDLEVAAGGEAAKPIATGAGAEGLAIDPHSDAIWVANRTDNTLTIVRNGVAGPPIATGELPFRIAFTHDGNNALVACAEAGEVQVFDAAHDKFSHAIHITRELSELSALPMGLCVDPEDHFAFVACGRGEFVAVLDLQRREVVDRIPARAGPDGIGYARLSPKVAAGDHHD